MTKNKLKIMLCGVGFTPDEAENIQRFGFRFALRRYHEALKWDRSIGNATKREGTDIERGTQNEKTTY